MNRYTLIDGLRGIAALMVVVFHLSLTVEASFNEHLPSFIHNIIKAGHWGVEIFFVISGFVIAHSVRNANFTFSYLASFGLRRSIRLDPPYWTVIVLEICLIFISLHFFPNLNTELPSTKQLFAHLFYLQELLGLGHLIPIFWTLCYEVQFYVVLVGSLVLFTYLKKQTGEDNNIAFNVFSIIGTSAFLFSAGTFLQLLPETMPGLFIDRWHQFFLGALAWWCTVNRGPRWLFLLVCLFTLALIFFAPESANRRIASTLIILFVSMLMFIAASTNNLARWLNSPIILFFGSISYGLYLVHPSIGWRLIALEKKLLGDDMNLLAACIVLCSGILVSILAAWLLHIWIEKPAMNLAHHIKLSKKPLQSKM